MNIFERHNRRYGKQRTAPRHRQNNTPEENKYSKKTNSEFIPRCEYIDTNAINDTFMNNTDKTGALTIFHCNLRSMKKNLSRVEELFRECTRMPDIIGVTETKHKEETNTKDEADPISLEGYKFEGCPSPTNSGGAGIFIRDI